MAELPYVYEPPELTFERHGWGNPAPSAAAGFDWSSFARAAGNVYSEAGIGAIGSGVGTILGFVGQLAAARQAKKAANYNAEVIRRNSEAAAQALENEATQHQRNQAIVLQDIALVKQAQAEQERSARLSQEAIASQTRAIIGASGLLLRGSPIAVYEHNLRESEREIMATRYRTDLQERAMRDQGMQEGYAATMARYGAGERLRVGAAQGKLARYGGAQQQYAGVLGAVGSLASGAARTYAAYERQQAQRGPTLRSTT